MSATLFENSNVCILNGEYVVTPVVPEQGPYAGLNEILDELGSEGVLGDLPDDMRVVTKPKFRGTCTTLTPVCGCADCLEETD